MFQHCPNISYKLDLNNLQNRKKATNNKLVGIELLINGILKALKHKYCLSLGTSYKYVT